MKKALSFHRKCVSCHLQGKQPVQNTNKMEGEKHYEEEWYTMVDFVAVYGKQNKINIKFRNGFYFSSGYLNPH